ncbi:MBL fold metallo-hydrolase [Arthrobacter sp. B3I4]|uniref:MBL fold metallo-hydrolase n=1 Tax=Arthrobacter sp. B3I4 TaxID=3042267 RepID=UPI002780BFB4|nr:MBL fold metallo-hydrolase [Arthrobacter sp. B3I4]MDQ0755818.1 L-ascorbate metabolism protein UlaG (beta-lactamase superfamily) [Arthrobacter sp. B3I4]
MKLTKFTHACVRIEKEGRVLVLDPGTFSEVAEALNGADAVLITHEHPDHIDVDAVSAVILADPRLQLYAPDGVAAQLRAKAPDAAERIHTVRVGEDFEAAGFAIRSFGGQHALIHPLIPVVANIGYLVDSNIYHPGDSFVIPDGIDVQTLLVPIHAPWNKVGEVVDFVVGVRAPRAFPIHDALLNDTGRGLVEGHVTRIGAKYGTEYRRLVSGESVEV